MDMKYSYKPVLLLGLLHLADASGKVKVAELVHFFRNFYLQRLQNGQLSEKPGSRMERITELSDHDIESILLSMPFEKFERRKFIRRLKELTLLKFDSALWKSLTEADKAELTAIAETALAEYYAKLT